MKLGRLEDFFCKRIALNIEVLSEISMYNVMIESDYIGVRLNEQNINLVPIELLFPDYFNEGRMN